MDNIIQLSRRSIPPPMAPVPSIPKQVLYMVLSFRIYSKINIILIFQYNSISISISLLRHSSLLVHSLFFSFFLVFGRTSKATPASAEALPNSFFLTGYSGEAGHEVVFGFHWCGEAAKSWLH